MSMPQLVGDVLMRTRMLEIDTNFPAYRIKEPISPLSSKGTTSNIEILGSNCLLQRERARGSLPRRNQEVKIFDDVTRQLFSDPFSLANYIVEAWDFDPGTLWKHACRTSVERVVEEIREVRRKPGISNRGGYLNRRLQRLT